MHRVCRFSCRDVENLEVNASKLLCPASLPTVEDLRGGVTQGSGGRRTPAPGGLLPRDSATNASTNPQSREVPCHGFRS